MSKVLFSLLIAGLLIGGAVYVATRQDGKSFPPGTARPSGAGDETLSAKVAGLERAVTDLGRKIDGLSTGRISRESAAPGAGAGDGETAAALARIDERLGALERLLEAGPAAGSPGAKPDFGSDDGFVHADLLFDQGKHASAAYGYLTFLDAHPDHPDARDFWRKARDALWKAQSYSQAIAVQERMMERFPDLKDYTGLFQLALIERDSGRLADAQRRMLEAAEIAPSGRERAAALRHHAACVQRSDGDAAGLRAYQEALRQTEEMGLGKNKDAHEMREQITDIQRRLGIESR